MFADKFILFYLIFLSIITHPKKINIKNIFVSFLNLGILRILIFVSLKIWKPTQTINLIQILGNLILYSLCEEFYTYFVHRFIHNHINLYLKIHKKHHEFYAEDFRLAFYMSINEILSVIYPSVTVGTWILYFTNFQISNAALEIWYCTSIFFFFMVSCRRIKY